MSPVPHPLHPDTRAIHLGQDFQRETGAVIPPIYATSTFHSGNPGGFDYTRSGNPNFRNLESQLASLEQAQFCTSFGSGVSAITAVVSSLKAGQHILAEENLYGCTYRLFEQVFHKFDLRASYVDFSSPDALATLKPGCADLIWIESPTNPGLKVLDIRAISQAALAAQIPVLVDNTFASPALQRPLELGATLSLSSTTKYCNGHSDALGGAVCTNDPAWHQQMVFAQKALGLQPSPFDAWLTSRGLKTLGLRMARHSDNALQLATFLRDIARAPLVRYPFLDSDPGYPLATSQMSAGSGIVTADFHLPLEEAVNFLDRLKLFTRAESLGGVESLVCHPASMTHASIPREVRLKVGISDSLVRFSCGIEHPADLIADVAHALHLP